MLETLSTNKKWTTATINWIVNYWILDKNELLELKEKWLNEKEIIDLIRNRVILLLVDELMYIADKKAVQDLVDNN